MVTRRIGDASRRTLRTYPTRTSARVGLFIAPATCLVQPVRRIWRAQARSHINHIRTQSPPGNIVPVKIDALATVEETNLEATAIWNSFVKNDANAIGHAALFRGRIQRANYQSWWLRLRAASARGGEESACEIETPMNRANHSADGLKSSELLAVQGARFLRSANLSLIAVASSLSLGPHLYWGTRAWTHEL